MIRRPCRRDLPQQPLGEETLVYTPEGGVCGLNPTAAEVWRLCDGARTRQEIAAAFSARYPTQPPGELRRQALATLRRLEDCGLLQAPCPAQSGETPRWPS